MLIKWSWEFKTYYGKYQDFQDVGMSLVPDYEWSNLHGSSMLPKKVKISKFVQTRRFSFEKGARRLQPERAPDSSSLPPFSRILQITRTQLRVLSSVLKRRRRGGELLEKLRFMLGSKGCKLWRQGFNCVGRVRKWMKNEMKNEKLEASDPLNEFTAALQPSVYSSGDLNPSFPLTMVAAVTCRRKCYECLSL